MKNSDFKHIFINLLLAVAGACLLFAGAAHASTWQWIDGRRVQSRLNQGSGLWLIDVRNSIAYGEMHIEGSVNIQASELAFKKFSPQKMLILVDDSLGQRTAREAAETISRNGYERVSILKGGITGWQLEGLPLVKSNNPHVSGVTAAELRWAVSNSVPMKIYDLRDEKKRRKQPSPGSEPVTGETLDERVDNVKKILASQEENRKDLAARMKTIQPVVLIFSAPDNAEALTRKILQDAKGDVRYLIGGYETMISDKLRKQQNAGACTTCPQGTAAR